MNDEMSHGKRILVVFLCLTLLIGLSFLPASWFGVHQINTHKALDLNAIERSVQEDSDNNGIPDWKDLVSKEVGTNNTTTDVNTEKTNALINDPNNITASLAKNIATISAYTVSKGITDDASQNALTKQAVLDEVKKLAPKVYTLSNITTDKKETTASLKGYGNALGVIAKKATHDNFGQGDVSLLSSYMDTKDIANLQKLQDKVVQVNEVIASLYAMHIPLSAAYYHIMLLNRIEEYKTILEAMSKADIDPVRSLIALQMYEKTSNNMLGTVYQYSIYFNNQNIAFTPKESGYIFTAGYTK
jgi:hypothetical protein